LLTSRFETTRAPKKISDLSLKQNYNPDQKFLRPQKAKKMLAKEYYLCITISNIKSNQIKRPFPSSLYAAYLLRPYQNNIIITLLNSEFVSVI
jgi:hypothetical protein